MTSAPVQATIRILPPELISRIAAGEVVERPASVLKELLENALDAGACRVRAEIEAGGIGRVRVTDDGAGMAPEDLSLAVQPHATSKLDSAEQLHALQTLGFRGEALPSIASVSRFSVTSRRRPGRGQESGVRGQESGVRGQETDFEDMAWRIEVDGGVPAVPEPRPAAGPYGTTIDARDLFYNLPARQKFLKGLAAEAAACADTLLRLALTRPDVAFSLYQGRSELLALPAAESGVRGQESGVRDPAHAAPEIPVAAYFRRAREALGRANSAGLIEVDYRGTLAEESGSAGVQTPDFNTSHAALGTCRLYGLLSPPAVTRPNRGLIYLTVNGRAVKDRTLTSALLEACRHLLPPRRFPIAVLYLEVPGGDVDINVHPAKSEVRFRQPGRIYALFYRAVRAACGLGGGGEGETGRQGDTETGSRGEREAAGEEFVSFAPHADLKFRASGPLFTNDAASADASDSIHFSDAQDFPGAVNEAPAPFGVFRDDAPRSFPTSFPLPLSPSPRLPVSPSPRSPVSPSPRPTEYRVIGQAAGSFIVLEDESGVRLIDQHALHERILFERLLAQARAHARGDAQGLLVPETVELSAAQAALTRADPEPLELLAHLGFACEPFGPRALLIRSVPAVLKHAAPARIVSELLEALAGGDDEASGPRALKRWNLREKAAYVLSCKAAIKAGERLTHAQMEALLAEFHAVAGPLAAPGALTCPHGRPLALEVSWYDLERAVGRKWKGEGRRGD